MKRNRKGLTLIEMLVVLGIIATIAGLLVPATQAVRRYAKNVQQQTQFASIAVALEAWKNDSELGQYPASHAYWTNGEFSGPQNLATALMGLDMRGYHPATNLNRDEFAEDVEPYYQIPGNSLPSTENIETRREHYLDTTVARPVRLGNDPSLSPPKPGLFDTTNTLLRYSYVLSDVFDYKSLRMPARFNGTTVESYKTVKVGSPILYFRANLRGTLLRPTVSSTIDDLVYNFDDCREIVDLKHEDLSGGATLPSEAYTSTLAENFYRSILNPIGPTWDNGDMMDGQPYRRDTYLLISAGADGIYGTVDDITNFGN